MIITKLTLENYKQYRGEHEFEIAEDATIGVVGANGVGKTTIFEAIEWCLYNPRTIRNEHIRPRGTGGQVRVVVQLTTDDGTAVYEIERILKRSGVQAAVYRLNEMGGGDPVVQGTRDVTDYISTKLIGLGHAAFVATFFTRQKELGFFGDMKPTERRREVGKLLGFETIKQAQQLIADDRTKARADAESLQRQYDDRTGGRDLADEIARARAVIGEHAEALETAQAELVTAEERAVAAYEEQAQHRDLQDRYNAIAGEARNLQTRRQGVQERKDQIAGELAHLERRAEQRVGLAAVAARQPELEGERKRLERERERYEARQRLEREMLGCGQTIDKGIADVRSLVAGRRTATDDPGWTWSDLDDRRPLEAIDRLATIASAINLPGAETRLAVLANAVATRNRLDKEMDTLQRYRDRQAELNGAIEAMLREGDPAGLRDAIQDRLQATHTASTEARSQISTTEPEIRTRQELVRKLEQRHFEDVCPTCGRPFNDSEAAVVIRALEDAIAQLQGNISAARQIIADAERESSQLRQQLERVQEVEKRLQDHRSRYESSREYITQQEASVEEQTRAMREVLADAGLTDAPTREQVDAAEAEVRRARALKETAQPLTMIRRTIADAQEARTRHDGELSTLADITWDPDAWREVSEKLASASSAAGAVQQIDQEIARRPQLEHDLEATSAQIAELDAGIAELTKTRDSVGFDPEALARATTAVDEARQAEREKRDARDTVRHVKLTAEHHLATLVKDEQQIKQLATDAEQMRQRWQELDLMYREFSEFDRFVAQRLTPQLADITSDIVAAMTDGKYDRVEFDEDYGIEVWVGSEEKFDLETFSGGERDAISLAARLALSRMIGSQAADPPSFLVLDEVFGSLDAERRERVLTLLGQHSHEFFRQMFVISHVDDVQQSPVFDTIWQVVQQEDGSSEVTTEAGEAVTAD